MFDTLAVDLSDSHKLFMVMKNLLPCYTLSVAPLGIRTLEELHEVCKRIDEAQALVSNPDASVTNPFKRRSNVNAISDEEYTTPNEGAVNRGRRVRDGENVTCYNCHRKGHIFKECIEERTGVFCFKCGQRGVYTSNCDRCLGNGRANFRGGERRNSRDHQ